MARTQKKIRYAVVGMGWFAQAAVLPAFEQAGENSELAALVTGSPEKARELSERYRVPAVGYDDYEPLLQSGTVDAVYIILPNALHREYVVRAARAGVHVLCEKPMAHTLDDCRAMRLACAEAGVKLMIAYRLHFEEGNLRAIETLRSGRIGEPRLFSSIITQQVAGGNTRLDEDLGGSPLLDVGIYPINASRYLFRAEPVEVTAFAAAGREPRFKEVAEMVSCLMRFPEDRLAMITCGFGEAKVSSFQVVGTEGQLRVDPAYNFAGEIKHYLSADGKTEEHTFRKRDQVAPEILYFSKCILTGKDPEPDGREGMIDVRIIEALQQSYREGRAIALEPFEVKPRPTMDQCIARPPVETPDLVGAEHPSGAK